jgi:hypothetical protein
VQESPTLNVAVQLAHVRQISEMMGEVAYVMDNTKWMELIAFPKVFAFS